jgi:hypothetical protein
LGSCELEVGDTLQQHQVRLQQHRRQGAYLSMSWRSLGTCELQQQLQQLQQQQQQEPAAPAALAAAAAVLHSTAQQQQQQQRCGRPIAEADEAEGVSSSRSRSGGGGGGRQYVYSSAGAGPHAGSSSVTSVNGFFEDVKDGEVEELQRQQIMQVSL